MRDRLFLPETISEALDTNLATGLRAIADALDSGHLDGKHLGTIAAAGGSHDDRIHLRVSLDLAAPILQRDDLEDAERGNLPGERALLHPPHDMNKGDYLRLHGSGERNQFAKFTPNDSESEPES